MGPFKINKTLILFFFFLYCFFTLEGWQWNFTVFGFKLYNPDAKLKN